MAVTIFSTSLSNASAAESRLVVPAAVTPGKVNQLQIVDGTSAEARALWTSFNAEISRTDKDRDSFLAKVPASAVVGIGAVRVITTNGVSDPQFVLIDPLRGTPESGTNSTQASAQSLEMPAAVDGACEAMKSDYFSFKARKGRQVAIEVVAQRFGSLLDPRLRLLDARGQELQVVDDSPGAGADCAFVFTVPESGLYSVELRDTNYEGGPKHFYRLRLGEFTLDRFHFNSEAIPKELIEAGQSQLNDLRELEPNDTPPRAQQVPGPSVINGGFLKPRDRDFYEFVANEGQRVSILGRTRSLGSDCDLLLVLQDESGKKIADANPAIASEPSITNTFRKSGTYRLQVEELNQQGGVDFCYQIEIRSPPSPFALSTDTATVSAPAGGEFEISVKPERQGYDGPITLGVIGLGDRIGVTNSVITTKTNAVKLKVTLPADFSPGDFRQFAIVGRGEVDGTASVARVSTRPALRRLFPELRHPPAALDGLIALGVTAPEKK